VDVTDLHCLYSGFQEITVVQDRSTGGKELKHGRLRLKTGRKYFTMMALRHGKRFPGDCVLPPCLDLSQTHLDKTVSNLLWPYFG